MLKKLVDCVAGSVTRAVGVNLLVEVASISKAVFGFLSGIRGLVGWFLVAKLYVLVAVRCLRGLLGRDLSLFSRRIVLSDTEHFCLLSTFILSIGCSFLWKVVPSCGRLICRNQSLVTGRRHASLDRVGKHTLSVVLTVLLLISIVEHVTECRWVQLRVVLARPVDRPVRLNRCRHFLVSRSSLLLLLVLQAHLVILG
jgi:hypothetical protein